MAASVVVLPCPVGPVTTMSPWWWCVASAMASGRPRPASVGIDSGMTRNDPLSPVRWRTKLVRKRPRPGTSSAKSHEPSSSNEPRSRSGTCGKRMSASASFCKTAPRPSRTPRIRKSGGRPATRCRSLGAHLARLLQQLLEAPDAPLAVRGSATVFERSGRRCRAHVGPRRLCLSGRGNDGRRGGVLQDHRYGRFARGRRGFAHDADLNLVGRSRGEDAERSYRVDARRTIPWVSRRARRRARVLRARQSLEEIVDGRSDFVDGFERAVGLHAREVAAHENALRDGFAPKVLHDLEDGFHRERRGSAATARAARPQASAKRITGSPRFS